LARPKRQLRKHAALSLGLSEAQEAEKLGVTKREVRRRRQRKLEDTIVEKMMSRTRKLPVAARRLLGVRR
jgi:hypothetical protein